MIRGDNGYSWLYWRDGSRHITAYPVKHYESKLPLDEYIRVHQNSIVNREFIKKVHLTHKGPQLCLSTGERLTVSRRRWLFVKRTLWHLF
jgi:DNA-binding LytR/AlgR family response regulator